jgi:N-6 DNA Methylase/TaqI-like C-terminal specificity domain
LASEVLKRCGISQELESYVASSSLKPFKNFDRATAIDFLKDFYRPSSSAYEFNFALMSKHALSRIYERYVALLEYNDLSDDQLSFIPPTPSERVNSKAGSVYTPQYVAGFFARYLRENLTARAFRTMRTLDPACGSGIFLRTILELQCNPLLPETTLQSINEAFASVTGVDRDPNACEATRLSLALLYLVASGSLPKHLDIRNADAVKLAKQESFQSSSYTALIANPPYVKRDHLSEEDIKLINDYLGPTVYGRADSYLAFVKLCLEVVQTGGFVCLVLPQAFLFAKNAEPLRKAIVSEFDVRCVVDLSAIEVFEGVGTYNVLLIVQKRTSLSEKPMAQLARVKEFVGPALQACLDRKDVETPYYSVFEVPQTFFKSPEWVLLSKSDILLQERLRQFKLVSEFMDVKQGFVTGADDVFIVPRRDVPSKERAVYVEYLPDRQIFRYAVPNRTDQVVFYPYIRGEPLTEAELRKDFPETWKYLTRNREKLRIRRAVTSGDTPWWRPVRPREPSNLLRPKIVCPHLMLTPRFALDLKGRYAVSHTPFFLAKERSEEETLLKFFCAVLNSSLAHWYLATYLPKYGKGYNRLEVSSVKGVPVPDPSEVPSRSLRQLLNLVDEAVAGRSNTELENEINRIVLELYGFSNVDRRAFIDQIK